MGAKPEPFGYFRCHLDGWEDCAPTAEGARPLYESPFNVPKLDDAEVGFLTVFPGMENVSTPTLAAFVRCIESAVRARVGRL